MTSHQNILQVLTDVSTGLSSNQAGPVASRKKNGEGGGAGGESGKTKQQNKVPELLPLTARPEKSVC